MNKRTKMNSGEYPKRVTGGALARPSFWKRLKRWLGDYKWPLIGLMWLGTIALGYFGFSKYYADNPDIKETRSSWDIFYLTLQLFILESGSVERPVGLALQLARFLAPPVAAYTAYKALANILREQIQLFFFAVPEGSYCDLWAGPKRPPPVQGVP